LSGLDLAQLDGLELDEEPPTSSWRLWVGLLLAGIGGFILYLPSTAWYARHANNQLLFFALCGGGILVGFTLGRWLWQWFQDVAARYEATPRAPKPDTPPSALRRWLTLLAVVGGAAAILVYVPAGA